MLFLCYLLLLRKFFAIETPIFDDYRILLQEIGQQNDTETETKCILLENHLDVEHVENYEQYLPKIEKAVTENEFENRLDLRFALSCSKLSFVIS